MEVWVGMRGRRACLAGLGCEGQSQWTVANAVVIGRLDDGFAAEEGEGVVEDVFRGGKGRWCGHGARLDEGG